MSTGDKVTALVVAVVALGGIVAWLFHWYVLDYKYWRLPAWRGRTVSPLIYGADDIVTTTGEILSRDEWEQLDPDLAAETLIAEWHDDGNEKMLTTDTLSVTGDIELLLWDMGRKVRDAQEQAREIRKIRKAYRAEMAWTLDSYRDALEHRRAA